jgi:hypothetical protein
LGRRGDTVLRHESPCLTAAERIAGGGKTVTPLTGTSWRIEHTDTKPLERERNMRKIIMLVALALVFAAGTTAIVVVSTEQASACKGRYCP